MPADKQVEYQTEIAMWRTLGDEPLRFRSWDGDYVVYSPFSGQTHWLDITAGYLIELLIQGPKDSEKLYHELSHFLGDENNNIFRSSIDIVIENLDELGLIENVFKE